MKIKVAHILHLFFLTTVFFSCKKDETPQYEMAAAYYPVQSGSVWVYRLDSTTIPAFGTSLEVHSYHLKDSAGNSFMDNTGNTAWPVYRFVTDTLEQTGWSNVGTYYVTFTDNKILVTDENNLRFTKLVSPVSSGINWPGNSYIDTRSATTPYQYLDGWNYEYDSVNLPFSTLAGIIDSSVTVKQRDETSPEGPFDPNFYQQRNYSVEVYAHGKGLIYKNFLHWTWQPTPEPARYEDDSFGIILNLLRIKQ